jgi:hypothetical protein
VTTQQREVTTSDRKSFPLPVQPDDLAKYAAEDLLLLNTVQQTAPPEIANAISHVGLTIQRLAMYAFAMAEETPPDIKSRITKRVDQFQQRANTIQNQDKSQWSGNVLTAVFDKADPNYSGSKR